MGRRSRNWSALSGTTALVVLLAAVGVLVLAALAGLHVQAAVRVLLQAERNWSLARTDAVTHLRAYGLDGDPRALEAYEETMEYPRAIRPALEAAAERPGDGEAVARAVEAGFGPDDEDVPLIRRFMSIFGTMGGTLRALDHWIASDRELRHLESLAPQLRQAVEQAGPASPPALALLGTIDSTSARIRQVEARFAPALTAWAQEVEGRIRLVLLLVAAGVSVAGVGVLRQVGRRISHAETELRESEARFRQVTEAIEGAFWLTDVNKQRMLYVSPGFECLFGRSPEDLRDDGTAWLQWVHPDDRERVRRSLPLQRRGEFEVEYRVVRPDGEVRWVRDRGFPVRDAEDRVIRLAGLAVDVTHLKELEEQLVEGRALRTVGRLAAGLSHEFNNVLTTLQGHAHLALMTAGDDPELRDDLEAVLAACDEGEEITAQLLSFAGEQTLVPESIPLCEVVERATREVRPDLPVGVHLESRIPSELPPAKVDARHLSWALRTLLTSVADADGVEGRLEVSGDGPVDAKGGGPRVHGRSLDPGRYLELRLVVPGLRLAEDERDRLFDPLPVGEAVQADRFSLALPAVYGILRQSGGGIGEEPCPDGKGHRFRIYLPVAEEGGE